ncbi:MAG: hypothetical protein GX446_10510 [Chthonomonadales bacterium]|nr:hypothetical protein [Chthonomonadales bacterium]
MAKRGDIPAAPRRVEIILEELLVRCAVGIGTGLLFIFLTPLFLGMLSGWWFVAAAGVGFLLGFVGGDVGGAVERRRQRRRR